MLPRNFHNMFMSQPSYLTLSTICSTTVKPFAYKNIKAISNTNFALSFFVPWSESNGIAFNISFSQIDITLTYKCNYSQTSFSKCIAEQNFLVCSKFEAPAVRSSDQMSEIV